jgi:hypothetical protein
LDIACDIKQDEVGKFMVTNFDHFFINQCVSNNLVYEYFKRMKRVHKNDDEVEEWLK